LGGLKREGNGDKYIYTVRKGDSLWIIGRRYDVTINQLCDWNGIKSRSLLRPGQKITLWVPTPGEKSSEDAATNTLVKTNYSRNEEGHIRYTVKKGDSLWLISRNFGVTIGQLQEWNKLPNGKHLQPGQTLVLLNAPALATGA
jgi:membrane-bound lytic murein transglycosylase D